MSPEHLPPTLRDAWLSALARRTAALPPGRAREGLETRLAVVQALSNGAAAASPSTPPALLGTAASQRPAPRPHPLAVLNAQIRQRSLQAQADEAPPGWAALSPATATTPAGSAAAQSLPAAAAPPAPLANRADSADTATRGASALAGHRVGGRTVTRALPAADTLPAVAAPAPAAPGLKAARVFQQHYARQRVDQRLHRALAAQPAQAGPLNSHSLVVQALQQLNAASPDYLQRLIAQLDALVALEALARAVAVPATPVASPKGTSAERRQG